MARMKAVMMYQVGGPELLQIEAVDRPAPRQGEVLIRTYATTVCPLDWRLRAGIWPVESFHALPVILGFDVAGVIEAVGAGVTRFGVGDEVYACCDLGGHAEYVTVNVPNVAHRPSTLNFAEAAAIPNSALTAWQALFIDSHLQPGQRLLIHGAAGAVGVFAVQLAKWRGAYVIGTASAHNHAFLRQLGADETIDYNTTRFEEVVGDVDVVLDTVGEETQLRSLKVLKAEGVLLSLLGPASSQIGESSQVVIVDLDTDRIAEAGFAALAPLLESGQVKPILATIFPFQNVQDAYRLVESRHARGKVVLQLIESPNAR